LTCNLEPSRHKGGGHKRRYRLIDFKRFDKLNKTAKVESIDSFSGHADSKGLLNWIKRFSPKPKKVFVVHGEPKSSASFAKKVEKLGIKTKIPEMNEKIIL